MSRSSALAFPRLRAPLLFSRKPTIIAERDWCDPANAADLADRIVAYWAARGRAVSIQLVDLGFFKQGGARVCALRSDMKNGLPK